MSKRPLSSERPAKRTFIKERDLSDYRDVSRPLELSDLVPPGPKTPRTAAGPSRRGAGSKKKHDDKRRRVGNAIKARELSEHFVQKLNIADQLVEGFSLFGTSSAVTTPPQLLEVETATVREVVQESVRVAKSKVKENFFEEGFEPALMHVTAHLVASKFQYAHSAAATGSTHFEELPSNIRLLEHVRMSSTTTMVGIANYLEHIGRFTFDSVDYVPYLRRHLKEDNVANWIGSDLELHHTPQIYSETFRRLMMDPYHGTPDRRRLMVALGIPIPDIRAAGGPEPAVPPGRNIVDDLAMVRRHLDIFCHRFPKCIRSIDIAAGVGSRMQMVAYEPPDGLEPTLVWSALKLEAMDLYVGAALGFCRMRNGLVPIEHHRRIAKSQIHLLVTGALSSWLNNLMSRG